MGCTIMDGCITICSRVASMALVAPHACGTAQTRFAAALGTPRRQRLFVCQLDLEDLGQVSKRPSRRFYLIGNIYNDVIIDVMGRDNPQEKDCYQLQGFRDSAELRRASCGTKHQSLRNETNYFIILVDSCCYKITPMLRV